MMQFRHSLLAIALCIAAWPVYSSAEEPAKGSPRDRSNLDITTSRPRSQAEVLALLQQLGQLPRDPKELSSLFEQIERLPPEQRDALRQQIGSSIYKEEINKLIPKFQPGEFSPEMIERLQNMLPGMNKGAPPSEGPPDGGGRNPSAPGAKGDPPRLPGFDLERFKLPSQPPGDGNTPFPRPGGENAGRPGPDMGMMIRQPNGPAPGYTPPQLPWGQDPSRTQDYQKLVSFWESNFGSLDKTPALKNAFMDIVKTASSNPDLGAGGGDSPRSQLPFLDPEAISSGEFGSMDWVNKSFEGSEWKMPDWKLGEWLPKWGSPSPPRSMGGSGLSAPSAPSGSFLPSLDLTSVSGLLGPLLLLGLVGVIAWVLYRSGWKPFSAQSPTLDLAQRAWPFDPRKVHDRATLVKAFEFLSLQLCGDAARSWNHRTIALAMEQSLVRGDQVSAELATLYELARYTPEQDALPPEALARARHCLCLLANVNPA